MRMLLGLACLVVVTACAPAPAAAPPTTPTPEAPPPRPSPTELVLTPTAADPSLSSNGCAAGQTPIFAFGFADLKAKLGARMGNPVSCERYGPEGDALQQTSMGLARYRKSTNIPTFISGSEHWALTDRGLLYWRGSALDPPADAEPYLGGERLPTPTPSPRPVSAAVRPTPVLAQGDDWLAGSMGLIGEYDRKHGTVLLAGLNRTRMIVRNQAGAWAAFVPSARTITLDPVLRGESTEAVATVLAHEAQHAVDWLLFGGARTEVACYSYEISAFRLEAAFWQELFGPGGKPDPASELEEELNEILRSARTDAGGLIGSIHERYADQCL